MKKLLLLVASFFAFWGCDQTTTIQESEHLPQLAPWPKEISLTPKELLLSENSMLYASDPSLGPLLKLFSHELEALTGMHVSISQNKDKQADIIFAIDTSLTKEAYRLDIEKTIYVRGGSYAALSMAKTTLLQLVFWESDVLKFPLLSIQDVPDASYRGLMIDLARKWHTTATIKQLIDLAAFYKLNYLQLHFTDDQSYTLPSTRYPNLPTPGRHYTLEELQELEVYSQARGITIVPEIDVPGHSSQFVKMYPEIFAIKDADENPRIINMGREKVYQVLDELIGEWASVFQASPYFHVGGDEANFNEVLNDPDVRAYMKANELGEDVHELYRHFLLRMNDIVKRHGKQMCVWEGFIREGEVEIPKDIIVFEFETNRYLPEHLVADGYTIVNTSWKPLYVVNEKKWSPETIYKWNMWRWENWWENAPSFTPIQLEPSPLVVGGQMCAWEQPDRAEIPSLRKRVPAFAERLWNAGDARPFDQFHEHVDALDMRLSTWIKDRRQDSLLLGYDFARSN